MALCDNCHKNKPTREINGMSVCNECYSSVLNQSIHNKNCSEENSPFSQLKQGACETMQQMKKMLNEVSRSKNCQIEPTSFSSESEHNATENRINQVAETFKDIECTNNNDGYGLGD